MIKDKHTDFVYLSALLPERFSNVHQQLITQFERLNIPFGYLPNTRDVWVRDFMPLQVEEDYFIQYRFDPSYLRKQDQYLKTDPREVCDAVGIYPNRISYKLDGGNMVKWRTKAITSTRVFEENPGGNPQALINEIRNQLRLAQLIVIPQEPGEMTGHADGIVRFVDRNTVLVNSYPTSKKVYRDYQYSLAATLMNAGLELIPLPYDAWQNTEEENATGCYINFLEVGRYIFFPVYAQLADQQAAVVLQRAFPNRELIDIDCRDIAAEGGALNCITWNIKTELRGAAALNRVAQADDSPRP